MNRPATSCKLVIGLAAAFVALGAADFVLTQQLVDSDNHAIESNPIAALVLVQHGWAGLGVYKVGLMTLIGCLGLVIFRTRPRVAELVMVFGCGAQAAVVLTSFFHVYAGDKAEEYVDDSALQALAEKPRTLPAGAMTVLAQSAACADLRLSEEQVTQVQDLIRTRADLMQNASHDGLNGVKAEVHRLVGLEDVFARSLSEPQLQRLQELTWQQRGPVALTDVDVAYNLDLSVEQVDAVTALIAKTNHRTTRNNRQGHSSLADRLREQAELHRQIATILDRSQQSRWREMQGEPFDFGGQIADAAVPTEE